MQTVTTIGVDIASRCFRSMAIDVTGQVIVRRQLKRRYILAFFEELQLCLVGIEACARHTIGRASCRHLATPCG
jgi:transposase